MERIIWNGQLMDRQDAKVDLEDRAYQFGDGIYEMVRIYNGHLFTLREHLERLMQSAEKIKMEIPYSIARMEELVLKLTSENRIVNGTLYIQISRGVSPRNHLFPQNAKDLSFVAYTNVVDRPAGNMENGVKARTVADIRWLKCDVKSLNLLGNILAKQEAFEGGCFEAILHRDGIVTEGSSSNICIVKDDVIKTHPADNLILNGIVRQVMIKLCEGNGIKVSEESFTIDELMDADELFMTSTTSEITPIIEVDGREISDGKPGELTRKLQALYDQEINKCCGMPVAH